MKNTSSAGLEVLNGLKRQEQDEFLLAVDTDCESNRCPALGIFGVPSGRVALGDSQG
jgi:hypothetical protein